jgi:hypothetical protein
MSERIAMNRIAMLAVLAAISVMTGGGAAALAAPAGDDDSAVEISSQATTMRTRPRIRVYPRYPRPYTTLYPLPYGVDYPGPNAVRQCVSRLVTEYRPSGTVIVPRMRCWWAWR